MSLIYIPMKKIASIGKIPNSNQAFEKKDIPQINFNTRNLDGLDQKIKDLKLINYQHDFIKEIEKILILYDENELKYNDRFVLFVMDEVEKFLLKSKSGNAKKDLVIEICKKYFNDDASLVELVIKLVFKEVSQVHFVKRQCLKLLRFFLKVKRNRL